MDSTEEVTEESIQTNAAQTRRQISRDRNRSHNLAQYTAVLRVHTSFVSFTCGLQNTSSADRHLTARRPSDHSRQTTQILAAESMSVENRTVSVSSKAVEPVHHTISDSLRPVASGKTEDERDVRSTGSLRP